MKWIKNLAGILIAPVVLPILLAIPQDFLFYTAQA
jgi:hypothetical protein